MCARNDIRGVEKVAQSMDANSTNTLTTEAAVVSAAAFVTAATVAATVIANAG